MNMTGFERLLRTLRGLATAYGIYVLIDKSGVYLYYEEDLRRNIKVPNAVIENEIAFEEFIKEFVREVKNGDSNKSERTDLSDMQSNDA